MRRSLVLDLSVAFGMPLSSHSDHITYHLRSPHKPTPEKQIIQRQHPITH